MVKPAARRQAVAHVCSRHDGSERQACSALGIDRSSVRYRSRRPGDAACRQRIRELAAERRLFGYRRRHFLLGKEGCVMNQKRFRRLYREEGLAVRKRPLCSATGGAAAMACAPTGQAMAEDAGSRYLWTILHAAGCRAGVGRLSNCQHVADRL